MANRRMFSKSVTDTDLFHSMPLSAQALYFHLGIAADDDGFVGNPISITRSIGAGVEDIRTLAENGYLIKMERGVYLITDWHINNHIRKDRYQHSVYKELLRMVTQDRSKRYVLGQPTDIPVVDPDKDSIG